MSWDEKFGIKISLISWQIEAATVLDRIFENCQENFTQSIKFLHLSEERTIYSDNVGRLLPWL